MAEVRKRALAGFFGLRFGAAFAVAVLLVCGMPAHKFG
jgi:hypothetical protein